MPVSHHWEFDSQNYHTRFRRHNHWIASDATPHQIGLADSYGVLSVHIPGPVPIYLADLIGLMLATWLDPIEATIYGVCTEK